MTMQLTYMIIPTLYNKDQPSHSKIMCQYSLAFIITYYNSTFVITF